MKHIASIIALCLLTSPVLGTFELSDPANEMVEESRAAELAEKAMEDEPLCVMEREEKRCWCFDRVTGDEIALSEEECMEHASKRFDEQQQQ